MPFPGDDLENRRLAAVNAVEAPTETEQLPLETETAAEAEVPIVKETVEDVVPTPLPLPGKGGVKHKELPNRIKLEAERLGFRVFVESPIGTGHESVDVVLVRDQHLIAVEISATTSVDAELNNLQKCLHGSFTHIALLSESPQHQHRLAALVPALLVSKPAPLVRCESPQSFLEFLSSFAAESEDPITPRVRGLKVRRSFSNLTPVDHAQRLEAAIKQLAQEMPKPP
ncbi:MAG: hypothetical protein ACKV19_11605 [Verrucomicrobiales bacterium]